jgi:iron complex transport system permease protein
MAVMERLRARKAMAPKRIIIILGLLIFVAFLISMNLGMIRLSPKEVMSTLFGLGTQKQELILYSFRLPRIVIAILAGMGLAVSGAIMQGVSKNALADPGILGINAGAGLAAVIVIMYTASNPQNVDVYLLPFAALAGAMLTATLIYVLAWRKGATSSHRLLLVGIAVGAGISAVMTLLIVKMKFYTIMLASIWLSGSLWGTNWDFVKALLPWIVILIPLTIYKSRYLNVLNLGDHTAMGLGTSVEKERIKLLVMAVALAASCVAVGGGIGFLGLVGPHIARKLVGPNHKWLIPVSALVGGLFLVVADMVGRNVLAPAEIPVGIVVSGIGAPYFLYLLIKSRRM